jgi:hypothetical protein
MRRVLYFNIYSFLVVLAGIAVLLLPFYRIFIWLLVIQILAAIKLFMIAGRLFSTFPEKKRMLALLVKRNARELRPETFQMYMKAPCSRLVARAALSDLKQKKQYPVLLKYKTPIGALLRESIIPVKTTIYINEELL